MIFVAAIIAGGVWSLATINVDSTPDITNNQVQVITTTPKLSTADVEQYVTFPVEQAMANLPGVVDLRSISRFGLSVVTVVFRDGMDIYLARQLVSEKLKEVEDEIPEGFGKPGIGPITTGLGEIFQYTLDADTAMYSSQELRTIQDWTVKRQLAMIPGVVDINSFGGSIKQYEVAVSTDKLSALGVTIDDMVNALRQNNMNTGGAYIESHHKAHFIRGEGIVRNLEDLRSIVVKYNDGQPVTVGQAADSVGYGEQTRYGAFTQDGHEAVGGMVLLLKGANSGKVVKAVKERMAQVQRTLPPGIKISPFLDRSQLIHRTTSTIARNLIEGALIVLLVLVLLLGSLRGGLITAMLIPLSLFFAFIMMKLFGVWANLMSLGAIDFGIIVDGAVIIVEGTVAALQKRLGSSVYGHKGVSVAEMDSLTADAAGGVMQSAFFGQLIILLVFVPIIFLTGVSGKMYRPMAYTFSFALIGAILLCLTYVPAATSFLLRPRKGSADGMMMRAEASMKRFAKRIINAVYSAYAPLLCKAMAHGKTVLVGAALLVALACVAFSKMGSVFVPSLDEGDIAMQTFLRPGSSLSETIKREEEVERCLLKYFPEVKTVCARIGVADIPTDPMGFDYTDSFIILEKDKSKWTSASTKDELIAKIEAKLKSELPGLNFSFSQPVALRFNELLTGVRQDVAVKVYGENLDSLNAIGTRMEELIAKVPGAHDVALERASGLPQITVSYNRERMAQYGISIETVNRAISSAFAGAEAGQVFEGEKRFDIVVRLSSGHRGSIDDVAQLLIPAPSGAQVPLCELADVDYKTGPMQITRDKAYRCTYVGVNVRGRDVASVVSDIKRVLEANVVLPAGYRIEYGGSFKNLEEAKQRMAVVVPIVMVMIFLMLWMALGSMREAATIFIAVPLSAVGGIAALLVRGMPFSISACIGFIVLFGVAVLNGLVLESRINQLAAEDVSSVFERVMQATHERLRPILLTACAAMSGFMPMAISTSAGAEVQRPLATVVIGGLFSATLLTLVVLPVLYSMFNSKRND